jgi:hypothetical protein
MHTENLMKRQIVAMLFTVACVSGCAAVRQGESKIDHAVVAVPRELPPIATQLAPEANTADVMALPLVDHVFDVTVVAAAELNIASAKVTARMNLEDGKFPGEVYTALVNTPTRMVFRRPAGVGLCIRSLEATTPAGETLRLKDMSTVMFPSENITSRFPNEGVPQAVQIEIIQGQAHTITFAPNPILPYVRDGRDESHQPWIDLWHPNKQPGDRNTIGRFRSLENRLGDTWLVCKGTADCVFTVGPSRGRPEFLYISIEGAKSAQYQRFECSPCNAGQVDCSDLGRFDIQFEPTVTQLSVAAFSTLSRNLPNVVRATHGHGMSFIRLSDRKIFSIGPENGIRFPTTKLSGRLPAGSYVVIPGSFTADAFHLNLIKAIENNLDLTPFGLPAVTVSAENPTMELAYDLDDLYDAAMTVPQQE